MYSSNAIGGNSIPYVCDDKGCNWENYEINKDYDYYSEADGKCSICQLMCTNDPNCGAVECSGNYCSWWKVGKCIKPEEFTATFHTCRKGK